MKLKQKFSCQCGRAVTVALSESPTCCGRLMRPGDYEAQSGWKIHYITVNNPSELDWVSGTPSGVYEVWRLNIGRINGEQLGWIAQYATHFEWRTVEGPPDDIRSGTCLEVDQACLAILCAIEGGVFAKSRIQEITGRDVFGAGQVLRS